MNIPWGVFRYGVMDFNDEGGCNVQPTIFLAKCRAGWFTSPNIIIFFSEDSYEVS
jgi:hypothetical protein